MSRKKRIITVVIICICMIASTITSYATNYTSDEQPTASGYLNTEMFIYEDDLEAKYEYKVSIATHNVDEKNGLAIYDYYYVMYSETEIVLYQEKGNYYVYSESDIKGEINELFWFNITETSSSHYLQMNNYNVGYKAGNSMQVSYGSHFIASCMYNSTYIFDSKDSAMAYLKTGILNGVLKEPSKTYDSEKIYLDNFRMEVHDSNVIEEFYVDFYYEPSQYLLDNIDDVYIELSYEYDIDFEIIAGRYDLGQYIVDDIYYIYIPLCDYPNHYRWNIKATDFISDKSPDWFQEWFELLLVGNELYYDLDKLSLGELGGSTVAEITKSRCNVKLVPLVNDCMGISYNGVVDFINCNNSATSTSTPDSMGNYTSNNDYTQQDGYYYTEVSQDSYGNNTYNYYYYNSDGQRSEVDGATGDIIVDGSDNNASMVQNNNNNVTIPDSINLNVIWNSDDDNDIIIEDDDYSADSLKELVDGGVGFFDDLNTSENDDGFLSWLGGMFGAIDPELNDALGFGMGATILICVLRSLFKR